MSIPTPPGFTVIMTFSKTNPELAGTMSLRQLPNENNINYRYRQKMCT